jgi:hypothetical protein
VSRAKRAKPKSRRKTSSAADQLPLTPEWKLRGRAVARRAAEFDAEDDEVDHSPGWLESRWFARTWNFVVGLSLLPFCWIFTDAIFNAFAQAVPGDRRVPFWATHEFLMFAGGAGIWLAWFGFCLWIWRHPRPLTLYVWGHELMHVLSARIFGGRIKGYEITREGGYIVTDRYNFLIALAPYLWPFASVPVLAIWGLVGWLPEAHYHREWFLLALGFTWMFHLSFTTWIIPIGQTDFAGPGRLFSFALIYLANVVLLSSCMVTLAPEVSWHAYSGELYRSAVEFYLAALRTGGSLLGLRL